MADTEREQRLRRRAQDAEDRLFALTEAAKQVLLAGERFRQEHQHDEGADELADALSRLYHALGPEVSDGD